MKATFALCASLLWAFCVPVTRPAAAQGTDDLSGTSHTTFLEYRETKQALSTWPLQIQSETKPFQKEPDTGRGPICRGTFQFPAAAGQSIGFLWDCPRGKLYLDLNNNRDLTDDPAGLYSCRAVGGSPYYVQNFTNVHLVVKTSTGNHRMLTDLNLYSIGSRLSGQMSGRSFWEGKLTFRDRDWQVGMVENIAGQFVSADSGFLLLRPWTSRDEPFSTQDGSLDCFSFYPNLFWGGQGYRVDCVFAQQDGVAKYKMTFREKPAELGEIKIDGKYIHRLVLSGKQHSQDQPRFAVVLDSPAEVIKVPLGKYDHCQVDLQAGPVSAHRSFSGVDSLPQPIEVKPNQLPAAVLIAGGPLTNTVSTGRHGRFLSFNYQLVGADGWPYMVTTQDRRKPPGFVIYKNGKAIHSGNFEFG